MTSQSKQFFVRSVPIGVDFVQAIFVDTNGLGRGKIYPIEKLHGLFNKQEEIVNMIGIMGTLCELPVSLTELSDEHYQNKLVAPDQSTFSVAPWSEDSSLAFVFFDIHEQNNSPFSFNPRLLAKNKVEEIEKFGYKLIIGFENEFRLFDKTTKRPYTDKMDLMGQFTQSANYIPYMKKLKSYVRKYGIDLENWHSECGRGQVEAPLKMYSGIDAIDKEWVFRETSKHVAHSMGLIASYMSFPLPMEPGNGLHINHSLWKETETGLVNEMWNGSGKEDLSEVGKHWLAGLLKHNRALCAFFSPTVNCYRRFRVADWCPNKSSWNINDRAVAFNVKISKENPTRNFIENRLPGSACNVYLAVAAMIVAGLDGLKNKLELGEPGNLPHCDLLPTSLSEALDALEEDEVMVKELGEKFVDWFIKIKRETDVEVLKDVNIDIRTDEGLMKERTKYLDL